MIQPKEFSWLLVLLSACSNCLGTILLKRSRLGMNNSGFLLTLVSHWFFAALLFYTIGLLVGAKALDFLPISRVVPVSQGISFILITFVSFWLFDESFAFNQFIASTLIFAGIVIMTFK